jgi:uncharacterized surface protein with fasciclin (FAS1) repeats
MDMNTQDKDIMVNMANAGNFTKLNNAMKAAGLVTNYKGIGPFTLFAPTDEAFDKLPKGKLESLLRDKAALQSILNLHAIEGSMLAKDIKASTSPSIQGETLTFAANDSGFDVNGARISKQEIEASNGVIHAIDTVMMPKGTILMRPMR